MTDIRRTEIGPETQVKGDIEAQEDVSILGRVEGTVKSTQTVTVEEQGEVYGQIEASVVMIAGVLVGNIRATSKVEVLETGCILGDIVTPVMVLVDGGAIKGRLIMDDSEPEPVRVNTVTTSRTATGRTTGQTGSRTVATPRTATAARPATVKTSRTAPTASRSRQQDLKIDTKTRKPAMSSAPLIDDVDETADDKSQG